MTLVSCSKKTSQNVDVSSDLDYYPLTLGKFIEYEVDSTVYTDLPVDTLYFKYRIKEKIVDAFTDNLGAPAIRLERYYKRFDPTKSYDKIPWTMKEVWLVNADRKKVQVVESNLRYTKLIFPVKEKDVWDGNANNSLGEWLYSFDYVNKTETINNQIFAEVLQVKQKEFKTLISYQLYSEKYAKGVGLVQREIINILSNDIVQGMPIEKRIEKGIIYKQTILNYGYE